MNSVKIELSIPGEIMLTLNKTTKELSDDIKKIISVELYNTGKLSLGKSSELADLCKEDFIKLLSEKGYSLFNWNDEEIRSELDTVKGLSKEMEDESNS